MKPWNRRIAGAGALTSVEKNYGSGEQSMQAYGVWGRRVPVLAIAGAFLCSAALPLSPAKAGDDGDAPMWVGIGTTLGMISNDKDPIDYRERGRLVVPKSMSLPPPGSSTAAAAAGWPNDPDLVKLRKQKAERNKPAFQGFGVNGAGFDPSTVATMSATAGQGPASRSCSPGSSSGSCGNSVTAGGLLGLWSQSDTLGPEPDRDWLTDPPKGYRAPLGALPTPTPGK